MFIVPFHSKQLEIDFQPLKIGVKTAMKYFAAKKILRFFLPETLKKHFEKFASLLP